MDMTHFLRTVGAASLAAAMASACSPVAQDKPIAETVPSTTKPGASVRFSHDLPASADASRRGTVSIVVNEDYDDGLLHLSATGSAGLTVYGASRTMNVAMAGANSHAWTLNYQADGDGVFFINIAAETEREGLPASMRAYAVRLVIGEGSAAQQKQAIGTVEQLEDGSLAIIMPAEEVIE
jgi:hypothetical protein